MSQVPEVLAPQPQPDPDTEPYWQATAAGKVALARCQDCSRWQHPPLERCRYCAGEIAFEPIEGAGSLHTWTVVTHSSVPGYATPYIIAVVDLSEGVRVSGLLLDVEPSSVHEGMNVEAVVIDVPGGDLKAPAFRAG